MAGQEADHQRDRGPAGEPATPLHERDAEAGDRPELRTDDHRPTIRIGESW